jgi:hypothetical protein
MAEIGVHVDEQIVFMLQSISNAGLDGGAESELAGAMKDVDPWIAQRQLIRNSPRTVGGIIVDDQHIGQGNYAVDFPHQRSDVVALVVRCERNEDSWLSDK